MPSPIPSHVDGLFDYQFHQVAIFCPLGVKEAVERYVQLGYDNWIVDNAELKGKLDGEDVVTKATMAFNYDIMPMELEFLHYQGPNRHEQEGRNNGDPFISHMSVYVDDVITDTKRMTEVLGSAPYHRFITQNHSNPGVIGQKRFIESIFDTRTFMGYDLKLIQKVPWNFEDSDWLNQEF